MMKTLTISILAMLWTASSLAAQPTLAQLRAGFFSMKDVKCGQLKFFESIKSEKYSSPVHQAYAGTAEAASAECVSMPYTKIEYFNRGKKNLEEAIKRAPDNAEVRFMRFATQANIPGFLFYDNIREDVEVIIKQFPTLMTDEANRDFWNKAVKFMVDSKKLTTDELAKFGK